MKKIKFLMLAALAAIFTLGLSSCNKFDSQYNYNAYQRAVNETVKSQKKNNKVILLVAFGTTWQQGFDAFDATVDAYKKAFSGYDVFLSYSSAICINRAAAGENAADGAEVRNYYAPPFWLTAFAQKGVMYSEVVVQSLQVIPGEEYGRVVNYLKDFANNANGDLDDDYLSKVILKLGVPLLQDPDTDVPAVAKALDDLYKSKAANDLVAFMGHGNPDEYDTYKANVRYVQLEEALQALSPNYFVGTVDMMENFKPHVYARMQDAGKTTGGKKLYLHPLMSIDGDHGHNDMAGDDLPEKFQGKSYTFAQLLAEANDEGEVEDCSWKVFFGATGSGLTCDNSTMIEKGLLELPTVRQIWMNHTQAAINGEPLEYYHSKNPEE